MRAKYLGIALLAVMFGSYAMVFVVDNIWPLVPFALCAVALICLMRRHPDADDLVW